jgi:hypothetical protein
VLPQKLLNPGGPRRQGGGNIAAGQLNTGRLYLKEENTRR